MAGIQEEPFGQDGNDPGRKPRDPPELRQSYHSRAGLLVGKADKEVGYFEHPTVYQVSDPRHEIMQTEFFGPMVSVYVYPDAQWEKIPQLVDSTSKYALTGSIFATDPAAIRHAYDGLKHSAGNFYVNTKSTGSVVGQQPFGGSQGSGTNDKVGSVNTLSRF
ncbi:hypothetical protein BP5796_11261 [Coleophoma crateriformis]|uniref:Aldehyde dehydrogenase domain-containing protein n=1 Tax=Coleophoma crateriformis TaxID=565419 RepID=A0A3D8QHW8_9HELO|nr:hypothetical protein BP5796_11261 [Coleophoma crateriformis]